MRPAALFLLILLFLPLAFTNGGFPLDFYDTGPSTVAPYPPEVTVYMKINGTPDARITKITYHCEGSNSTATGAASQRIIDLPCTDGVCSNADVQWFYKYNPCFDFRSGSFSYELEGKGMRTDRVNFPERGRYYDITIESESGMIRSAKKSNRDYPCASAFLIPFVLVAAFASKRC